MVLIQRPNVPLNCSIPTKKNVDRSLEMHEQIFFLASVANVGRRLSAEFLPMHFDVA